MHTVVARTLSIAMLAIFTAGAFAADRVNANNNKVTQINTGTRAEQTVRIGVMSGPLFGSAKINASNNTITQVNGAARAKQSINIGLYR